MADREVRVKLAVAGTAQFQRDMQSAAQATTEVGTSAAAADNKLANAIGALRKLGSEAQQAGRILGGPPKQIEALAKASGKSVAQVRAELEALVKSANDAGVGLEEAGQKAEVAAKKTEGSFAGMSGKVKGAIAGIAFGAFVSDAISAASDLNETLNKSSVIFGDQAKEMESWAEGAAKNLGLSKAAALDAAAGFGDMFSQLGFTSGQAADMSQSTVQLAADLGSFNNLGTDEVLDKISGAMRGEYDSLQALIPNINGARVEQEALTETGKKSAAQLTAQEKATATLAIVTKDSARAQGDFAKTSDGLANSQKIAAAQFEDTKAKIGQSLLPVMQKLVQLISTVAIPVVGALGKVFELIGPVLGGIASAGAGLISFFTSLPAPIQAVVGALGALAALKLLGVFSAIKAGAGAVLSPLRSMSLQLAANRELAATTGTRFSALGGVMRGVGGAAKSLGSGLLGAVGGPVGLAVTAGIALITLGLSDMKKRQAEADAEAKAHTETVSNFADALRDSNGAIDDNVQKMALQLVQLNGGAQMARDLGVSLGDLVNAELGVEGAQEKVSAAYQRYTAAQDAGGRTLDASLLKSTLYDKAMQNQGLTLEQAKIKQQQDSEALAEAAAANDTAKIAADAHSESLREASAANRDNAEAAKAASESRREGTAASRDAAIDADAYSAAVASAAAATRDGATAEESAAEAKAHAAAAAEELAGRQDTLNRSYEQAQAAADAAGQALSTFEQASQDSADAQSQLASQAQRVSDELDRQSGRTISLEEANARASATGDDLAETFKQGAEGALRLSSALINADGTISTADATGRTFRDGLLATRDAMVTQATAAYEAAGGANNVAAASAAATAAQQGTYNQFISTATAAGFSATEAENLAVKYKAVPTSVTTAITADDRATAKVAAAKAAAESFAQSQYEASISLNTSSFDAQIASAKARMSALGSISSSRVGPLQFRAAGGPIFGAGTGTSDEVPFMGSNGEHVWRADEVSALGGHGAMYRLRAAARRGNLPRFATGGPVGGSRLAGLTSRDLGDREGLIAGSFKDLADAVRDLRGAAADLADEQQQATKAAAGARSDRRDAEIKGRGDTADVRKANAEKLAEAQRKLNAAEGIAVKSRADQERRTRAITAAEANLSKVRRQSGAAMEKAQEKEFAANRVARVKVAAAQREEAAAIKAARAAADRAKLAERVQRQEIGLRSKQEALARRYDAFVNRVEATENRLDDLRSKQAGLIEDGRQTALGIRGGLLGSPDFQGQKLTVKDLQVQLRSANVGGSQFDSIVKRAAGLGVSGSILDQLSKDPDGRGGQVLRALAGGTKRDAASVNSLYASLGRTGAVTGNRISAALGINSQISATSAVLRAQQSVVTITDKQLRVLGDYMGQANAKAFDGKVLAVNIGDRSVVQLVKLEIKSDKAQSAAKIAARRR